MGLRSIGENAGEAFQQPLVGVIKISEVVEHAIVEGDSANPVLAELIQRPCQIVIYEDSEGQHTVATSFECDEIPLQCNMVIVRVAFAPRIKRVISQDWKVLQNVTACYVTCGQCIRSVIQRLMPRNDQAIFFPQRINGFSIA